MKSPHASIYQISPYVAGNVVPADFIFTHNLASNENPFGASPTVYNAIATFVESKTHTYPDGNAVKLRKKISETFSIPFQNILCGCGSEELLHLLARTYLSPGDEVLIPRYGFSVYNIAVLSASAVPIFVERESKNKTLNVSSIIAAVTPRTRMIYIDHPGNPIGNFLDYEALTRLIQTVPPTVMIILDAAYAEYMNTSESYTAGHEFIEKHPNVVVARSFSKAYGLAGVRLGWMHAAETVIDAVNRIRAPFNTSTLAQYAGIAALGDLEFVYNAIAHTHEWRKKLDTVLCENNMSYIPCCTNFTLVHLPGRATELYHTLGKNGIIVRPMTMYKLTDHLRISIGTAEAMTALFKQIQLFNK
ncbi:MAG: aminotransferase class I/II-fold pyridoxal phosphate-dependent enzyme [Alphaproteobacteria bacterium]|nr:aminotransferase class I/II-fold pyridoxal phosphate-dependent enzyme [Alphaproteobacteria bacterium]